MTSMPPSTLTAGATASTGSSPSGRVLRRFRAWGPVVVMELLHMLMWLPAAIALIPAILFFHLAVPIGAALERRIARRLGAEAPSGRGGSERRGPWLLARVAHTAFWYQDLPLCLGAFLLGAVSVGLSSNLLVGAVSCIVGPLAAAPDRPVMVQILNGTVLRVTDPMEAWWLIPIGLVLLCLAAASFLGVGLVRLRLIVALSGDRSERRVQQLTAEVGHLTAGRATLMDAFEAERARIERDLHDGAQQDLVALTMSLGILRLTAESLADDDATGSSRTALLAGIDSAQDRAEAAMRNLRETVHGIRPAVLSERGLAPALKELAGRASVPTAVVVHGDQSDLAAISQPVATVVYFAVAEALTNSAKHAHAQHATVLVDCTSTGLSAVVTDDGRGGASLQRRDATGLRGMVQRVESVGGRLEVDSPAGAGTRLLITTPLAPPWSADAPASSPEDVSVQAP